MGSLVITRTWKRKFFVLVYVCFILFRSPPRGPVLKWTFFYKLIDTFSTFFNATVGSLLVLSSWGSEVSSSPLVYCFIQQTVLVFLYPSGVGRFFIWFCTLFYN